jgi:hypothetical protein
MLQTAKGYLYTIHGDRPRIRSVIYDALGPNVNTGYGLLPHLDPTLVFIPFPPFAPNSGPDTKHTIISIKRDRFLVLYYVDRRTNPLVNETLTRVAGGYRWRGEIAIFPLGCRVPFKSWGMNHRLTDRVAAL